METELHDGVNLLYPKHRWCEWIARFRDREGNRQPGLMRIGEIIPDSEGGCWGSRQAAHYGARPALTVISLCPAKNRVSVTLSPAIRS